MVLFEDLYTRIYRSLIGWFNFFEVRPWSIDFVRDLMDRMKWIHN